MGPRFDLGKAIARGLLPSVYFSDDPPADLDAYTGTYLQQEIVAEGATRNVPAFSRFLHVAALCNATEEKTLKRFLCVSLEDRVRQVGVVRVLPYRLFLEALWDREFTP